MPDDQIMKLGPEDDLTSMRERLKREGAQQIRLEVSPQTQLRSYTAWQRLYADARNWKKDITVVSSDHAIKSMAEHAGFRVDARRASSPGSSRPSKSDRPSNSGQARASFRSQAAPARPARPLSQPLTPAARDLHIEDLGTGGPTAPLFSSSPSSSTFGTRDYNYGPDYPPAFSAPHSLRAVSSDQDQEQEDEDEAVRNLHYQQAKSIREAAGSSATQPGGDAMVTPETPMGNIPETPYSARAFNATTEGYDAPAPSQFDFDTALPPPQSGPGGVSPSPEVEQVYGEIIDEGDLGRFPNHPLSQDIIEGSAVEIEGNRRPQEPPRSRRIPSPEAVKARRMAQKSSKQSHSSGLPLESGSRQQPPVMLERRPVAARTVSPAPSTPTRRQKIPRQTPVTPATTTGATNRPTRARRGKQQRRNNSGAIILLSVVLVIIIVFILGFTVPAANVTVTLASSSSDSVAMAFTATATSSLNLAGHTLPAELLTYDTSVEGEGQATGSTTVGTVPARGTETFTNNGAQPVHIPTGTVIATTNNIQFVTTADALVLTGSNNTSIVPIQAQTSGVNGNVGAGSITVIPSSSMNALQQVNTGQQIKLTITNASATTGGGTGIATTISKNDVSREQSALAAVLQNRVNDFLRRQVHVGDQMGKPNIIETPMVTPPVGTIVSNKSFTLQLSLHMKLLVVRASRIQSVAAQVINALLKQQKPGYELVPQQTLLITHMKNVAASDGNSLQLSFTAQGQIAPQISADAIRAAISGKSISDARSALLSGQNGLAQIKQVTISISPSFFPKVPYWQQRIAIHFLAVPSPVSPSTPPHVPKKTK
jgi:hypothetical protein